MQREVLKYSFTHEGLPSKNERRIEGEPHVRPSMRKVDHVVDGLYPTLSEVWYSTLGGVRVEASRSGERVSLNRGSKLAADSLACHQIDFMPSPDDYQFGRSSIQRIRTAVPEAPQRY